MSWSTIVILTIILTHVESSHLLPWNVMLDELTFSKMPPSLVFIVVFISRNERSISALLWEATFSRASTQMMQPDEEDKSCGGKLNLPPGLKECLQISGHTCLPRLLYLCLWRSLRGHYLEQSRKLITFWRISLLAYLIPKSPACQKEFYTKKSPGCQKEFYWFGISS